MVKGKSYSLKEFIEQAPGAPPADSLLPHRPGERPRDVVDGGLSRMSLGKETRYNRFGQNESARYTPTKYDCQSPSVRSTQPYPVDHGPRRGEYPVSYRDKYDVGVDRSSSRENDYVNYLNGPTFGRRSRGDDYTPYDRPGSRTRQEGEPGQPLSRQSSGPFLRPGSAYGTLDYSYGRPDSSRSSEYYPQRPNSQRSDDYYFGRPPSSYSEHHPGNNRTGEYPIPRPDSARSSETSYAPRQPQRSTGYAHDHDTYAHTEASPRTGNVRPESSEGLQQYSSRNFDRHDSGKQDYKPDHTGYPAQAASPEGWHAEDRKEAASSQRSTQPAGNGQSHNSFADQAAKLGAARLAAAKTCLVTEQQQPAGGATLEHTTSENMGNGDVFIKPVQPGDRPRLNLKPKSELQPRVNADNILPKVSRMEQRPKLTLEPRTKPVDPQPDDQKQRPKLNLKPRSKPLDEGPAVAETLKKASVFGLARPREAVLKERGVEPVVDDPPLEKARQPSPARTSSTNWNQQQNRDQWHTVTVRRNSRRAQSDELFESTGGVDPFFSDVIPSRVTSHSPTDMLNGYSSGHLYHSLTEFAAYGQDEPEDDSVFPGRRALPTRSDDFF